MELLFKHDIKAKTDIKAPQNIIAYYNGKKDGKRCKVQYSTGIKVKPSCFSNQKVVRTYEKLEINPQLDKMRLLFKQEQLDAKKKGLNIDKAVLIRVVNEALGYTEIKEGDIRYYSEYLPHYLSRLSKMKNQKGEIGLTKSTHKTYNSSAKCYKRYEKLRVEDGYSPMTLQYGTADEVEAYQDYLVDEMGYAPDTINKRIGMVKSVSRNAKKRKYKVSEDLTEYDVPSKQPRKKEDILFLTPEEVEMITAAREDLPSYLINTQRIVILHIATGQRISDVMKFVETTFKETDKGVIASVRQQKTGKEVEVPFKNKRAIEVVRTGLFKAISHQKYNEYIKELAQRVGINQMTKSKMVKDKRLKNVEVEKYKLITSHSFRRTALSNLYLRGNIPEHYILNISGHSRAAQLHQYLGINPDKEAQTNALMDLL